MPTLARNMVRIFLVRLGNISLKQASESEIGFRPSPFLVDRLF